MAGEAVRERFGDAGLLASDLPDGDGRSPASAWPRVAERTGRRQAPRVRRARRPWPDAETDPVSDLAPARAVARPSIETRLAAAGLPPLPRTAWLEIDLDALGRNLAS